MHLLKLDSYTTIFFHNKAPIQVSWSLGDIGGEWPSNEELINEVRSRLQACGWDNLEFTKPKFDEDGPYSDLFSQIKESNLPNQNCG